MSKFFLDFADLLKNLKEIFFQGSVAGWQRVKRTYF